MAVARVGSVFNNQNIGNDSFSITVPSGANAIIVTVTGYIAYDTNPLLAALNFDNGGTLDFNHIVSEGYYTGSIGTQISHYIITSDSPDWPGVGTHTIYYEAAGTVGEGFDTNVYFYSGVDPTNPIIGTDSAFGNQSGLWTSSIASVTADDMGIVGVYRYLGVATSVDINSQTEFVYTTSINSAASAIADKAGEGALQVNRTDSAVVCAAFAIKASTGAAGITGISNVTLDVVGQSGVGDIDINGASNIVLNTVNQSAQGDIDITGISNVTLDVVGQSGVGDIDINGVSSITLDVVAQSGAGVIGSQPINGTSNIVLNTIIQSAQGDIDINGTSNVTLDIVAQIGQGTANINGASSITLDIVAQSGAGVIGSQPINGTSNVTLDVVAQSSAGNIDINGVSNIVLNTIIQSAQGDIDINGTSNVTLDIVAQSGAGVIGSQPIPTIMTPIKIDIKTSFVINIGNEYYIDKKIRTLTINLTMNRG